MKIDLHSHSTYSDGTLDPDALIDKAHGLGLTHLALADHDSTGGLEEARERAKKYGLTVIPAVEINSRENTAIHILGYYIDEFSEDFQKRLSSHREIRIQRTSLILEKLQKMGIRITLSDFKTGKTDAAIGRPHIADKLKEKGVVFSRQEAFSKYLSANRPAYVFYDGPTPQDAIEIILAAKGVPVVAHPGFSVTEQVLEGLVKAGLQGIEVHYPSHRPEQVSQFLAMAKKYDLVVTGGSDYHGPGSGHESMGEFFAPESALDELQARRQKLFS